MLSKVNRKDEKFLAKPLTLHRVNCIICNNEMQQTTPNDDESICYRCYQTMRGKRQYTINQPLKKAAHN